MINKQEKQILVPTDTLTRAYDEQEEEPERLVMHTHDGPPMGSAM